MRGHALPFALLLSAVASDALRLGVKQARKPAASLRRRSGSHITVSQPGSKLADTKVLAAADDNEDGSLDLNTVHDLIYIANVTVGGHEYPVQLDTGSSDLWLKGPSTPLPNTTQTSQTYNLTYGIGWAFGTVSYASVQFADLSVSSQAYLDVSTANNPALSYGADGILGLGFTSLSTIDALVNGTSSSAGRSLLYNLFAAHPAEPNFIAFSLQRTTANGVGAADDVEGSFAVGEYEPAYKAVADSPALPTWPVAAPTRWNVLLESFVVANETMFVNTTVEDAPSNRAVVLMDSGTSYTYAPVDVCAAIYGGIEGAKYDTSLGQWVVPCDAEIDLALQFGGQMYPIHPLDVAPYGLSDTTTCVGSFVPQAVAVGAGEFDWLIGDNVLRSMYSVYDFGDFDASGKMGAPYVKLLSLVEPNEASVDFAAQRGSVARTGLGYSATNVSASTSGHSVSISTDFATLLGKFGMYLPAVLGIVALNTVVLTALLVVAVLTCCRRRIRAGAQSGARPRSVQGRTTPMSMSMGKPHGSAEHVYEPVSMALADDNATAAALQPPGPGYRYDPEAARPHSYAPGSRLSSYPPLDESFQPPEPAFSRTAANGGDRPRSVA